MHLSNTGAKCIEHFTMAENTFCLTLLVRLKYHFTAKAKAFLDLQQIDNPYQALHLTVELVMGRFRPHLIK